MGRQKEEYKVMARLSIKDNEVDEELNETEQIYRDYTLLDLMIEHFESDVQLYTKQKLDSLIS